VSQRLSEYLTGQRSEPETIPEELDFPSEEEDLDNCDFSLREEDSVWEKRIKNPIAQQLDLNHTSEELHQRSIDFKKSLQSKEDFTWDERFKPSIARQLNLYYTPEELYRMNIDREKLIKIELTVALRQREFTPKEKIQLFKVIYAMDRSPEQLTLNAIFSASYTPKTSFKRVESIIKEGGADVNSKYNKFSFLIMAAGVYKNQGHKIIQFLLDKGADIEIADDYGRTALHNAVREKNIKIVELLLNCGANVNVKTKFPGGNGWIPEGWTPLHVALDYEHFKIAKVLLAAGADSNIRDEDGKIPFDMAMKAGEQIDDETERRKFYEALNELPLQTP
jgi:hypothetical protein